jgi:hypothetical protein
MLTTGGRRPHGLDSFTDGVYRTLEAYIMSPWNILKTACSRQGLDPLHISGEGLALLLDPLELQVSRITDEEHAGDVRRALSALIEKTEVRTIPMDVMLPPS